MAKPCYSIGYMPGLTPALNPLEFGRDLADTDAVTLTFMANAAAYQAVGTFVEEARMAEMAKIRAEEMARAEAEAAEKIRAEAEAERIRAEAEAAEKIRAEAEEARIRAEAAEKIRADKEEEQIEKAVADRKELNGLYFAQKALWDNMGKRTRGGRAEDQKKMNEIKAEWLDKYDIFTGKLARLAEVLTSEKMSLIMTPERDAQMKKVKDHFIADLRR
jgi:hypothetical protein